MGGTLTYRKIQSARTLFSDQLSVSPRKHGFVDRYDQRHVFVPRCLPRTCLVAPVRLHPLGTHVSDLVLDSAPTLFMRNFIILQLSCDLLTSLSLRLMVVWLIFDKTLAMVSPLEGRKRTTSADKLEVASLSFALYVTSVMMVLSQFI